VPLRDTNSAACAEDVQVNMKLSEQFCSLEDMKNGSHISTYNIMVMNARKCTVSISFRLIFFCLSAIRWFLLTSVDKLQKLSSKRGS
jgi:hypothetical protein